MIRETDTSPEIYALEAQRIAGNKKFTKWVAVAAFIACAWILLEQPAAFFISKALR